MFGTGHLEQMLVDLRKVDESVNTQLSSLQDLLVETNGLLAEILEQLKKAHHGNPD